jgi:hypothetical protein
MREPTSSSSNYMRAQQEAYAAAAWIATLIYHSPTVRPALDLFTSLRSAWLGLAKPPVYSQPPPTRRRRRKSLLESETSSWFETKLVQLEEPLISYRHCHNQPPNGRWLGLALIISRAFTYCIVHTSSHTHTQQSLIIFPCFQLAQIPIYIPLKKNTNSSVL